MAAPPPQKTRYLRAAYLADTEGLLKETRGTKLYYFPGPIVAVLLFGILVYSSESARNGALPAFPGLTSFFMNPTVQLRYKPIGKDEIWDVLFGLLFLVSLIWLLVRYLRWMSTVYAITTTRVIVQRGILGREFDEIPITQVRGVDVRQSLVQRLLHYGTVRVSSEGGLSTVGNEDWLGIPRPFDFQRLVESASQALARGGSLNPPPKPDPRYPALGMDLPKRP